MLINVSVSTIAMCSVVPVSEASVIIAVSSTHRKEALEAVAFAIEAVKASTAIWKKAREMVYLWSCLVRALCLVPIHACSHTFHDYRMDTTIHPISPV